ncbi:phosphotransferase [Microlunatus elymi]|uniref:Phosphotransferase n=1 Tax=Microlunatus elymi TaxID=2596828 RepID=A0A516PYA4_9ACTN|nr:phosphotransferase [Microlunatus elymi]QDP96155.1 phosphotransferase [Microlunatus elymi]
MFTTGRLTAVLKNWTTLLGADPILGAEDTGRGLWPIVAEDGRRYFLKRLSPWRNLPVADEARVLRWLAQQHVDVAEFMITDQATLTVGPSEDSYTLIPQLDADRIAPADLLRSEETIGQAIAELHRALAGYPWSANSYREQMTDALQGDLLLPPDLADSFALRRESVCQSIELLLVQLVNGDLTPENILLRSPGQVAGFIDFDHLPLAPRVWDIAKYLSRRLRLRWRERTESAADRVAHIGPLIRGYQRANPLSGQELNALPACIAAGNIIEASYGQEIASGQLERRMLPDHDQVLADTIEAARWQLANYTAVEEAVRSAGP